LLASLHRQLTSDPSLAAKATTDMLHRISSVSVKRAASLYSALRIFQTRLWQLFFVLPNIMIAYRIA